VIPRAYITEWRAIAPWSQNAWVEQDLIISRALVAMFGVDDIAERLAFRGGSALFKLYLHPAARYSEDIDLVQIHPRPIGETLDLLRKALDPWLGTPRRTFKEGRVNLVYRFESEDTPPMRMRVKVEINSREHFSELGIVHVPYRVENRWFSGNAQVTTFEVDELLGTKLRALYQRKKGRDLFDLWFALERGVVDENVLLNCFARYMTEASNAVTRAQFEANLHAKAGDREFRGDIRPLLRPGTTWDFAAALKTVQERLIQRLPGEPWRGADA